MYEASSFMFHADWDWDSIREAELIKLNIHWIILHYIGIFPSSVCINRWLSSMIQDPKHFFALLSLIWASKWLPQIYPWHNAHERFVHISVARPPSVHGLSTRNPMAEGEALTQLMIGFWSSIYLSIDLSIYVETLLLLLFLVYTNTFTQSMYRFLPFLDWNEHQRGSY